MILPEISKDLRQFSNPEVPWKFLRFRINEMKKSWIGWRNLPFLQLIPFHDNVCYRKVQGMNIISCFRKHDVLMKYERHIKQVWHFILISRDKEICSSNGSNKLSRVTAQGQLTFRHLQQRNILIFRGYSHFYQSGYTSLPLVMGQSFIIII